MDSLVSFFKIIFSSQQLRIPKAFVNQIHGELPEEVLLVDKYKNQWRVGVSKDEESWWFDKGWSKLYEENSLEVGNLMVFEHKGNNLFHFKLLGANACEKEGVPVDDDIKCVDVDSCDEDNGIQGINCDDDEDKDHSLDQSDDDDEEEEEDMITDDDDYDEEEEQVKKPIPKKQKSSTQRMRNARKHAPHAEKARTRNDWYGLDIFKSGLAPKPVNPYFVTRSRTGMHKDKLIIPNQILFDYGLTKPKMVTLTDEMGRIWKVKTKQWKDGRVWCTRGWKSLCAVNNIEWDDVCICELMQEVPGNMRIQVSVADVDRRGAGGSRR